MKSDGLAKIAQALILAKQEIGPILKDASNKFLGNKYASLAAVIEATEEPLARHGLVVLQLTQVNNTTKDAELATMLLHTSGEFLMGYYPLRPKTDDPQGLGGAFTYARRYTLLALLGVAAEDDDGESATRGKDDHKTRPYNPPAQTKKPTLPAPPKPKATRVPMGDFEPTAIAEILNADIVEIVQEPLDYKIPHGKLGGTWLSQKPKTFWMDYIEGVKEAISDPDCPEFDKTQALDIIAHVKKWVAA